MKKRRQVSKLSQLEQSGSVSQIKAGVRKTLALYYPSVRVVLRVAGRCEIETVAELEKLRRTVWNPTFRKKREGWSVDIQIDEFVILDNLQPK